VLDDQRVTAARIADAAAERAWRDHARVTCAECSAGRRAPGPDRLCPVGVRLVREHLAAAAELRDAREAAAAPNPDQGALFDLAPADRRAS
jgi:hypothetical protein